MIPFNFSLRNYTIYLWKYYQISIIIIRIPSRFLAWMRNCKYLVPQGPTQQSLYSVILIDKPFSLFHEHNASSWEAVDSCELLTLTWTLALKMKKEPGDLNAERFLSCLWRSVSEEDAEVSQMASTLMRMHRVTANLTVYVNAHKDMVLIKEV